MTTSMHRPALLSVLLLIGISIAAAAPDKTRYPQMAPLEQYLIANPQEEIVLARSAAPPSVSAEADVMVLGKHGYESVVKGKNGFVCFVERSWTAGLEDDKNFWDPKIRGPNCFNPPAVRSVLPQYIARTEWVLAGASRREIIERSKAAVASHQFLSPEAGSLSFMLSKQGYLGDDAGGPWYPHVMFFVPQGHATDWASQLDGSPVLGEDGSTPYEPTVLYIPVPAWSDGSPSPQGQHHH
jgi:hypothetical protein